MTPQELVRKLHAATGTGCIVVTGAGAQAITDLFSEPGASRTVLDAQIPYSSKALEQFVGKPADQHVSETEARLIAFAAYERAVELAEGENSDGLYFGVGCTAAIATDRVRRGEDRAHIAWTNGTMSGGTSVKFDKSKRTRSTEEAVVSALVLNSIAESINVEERLAVELFETEELDEFD